MQPRRLVRRWMRHEVAMRRGCESGTGTGQIASVVPASHHRTLSQHRLTGLLTTSALCVGSLNCSMRQLLTLGIGSRLTASAHCIGLLRFSAVSSRWIAHCVGPQHRPTVDPRTASVGADALHGLTAGITSSLHRHRRIGQDEALWPPCAARLSPREVQGVEPFVSETE